MCKARVVCNRCTSSVERHTTEHAELHSATLERGGHAWAANWTNAYRSDEQHLLVPQVCGAYIARDDEHDLNARALSEGRTGALRVGPAPTYPLPIDLRRSVHACAVYVSDDAGEPHQPKVRSAILRCICTRTHAHACCHGSGSAFVYGLFEGTGTLGPAKYQPVSIWSDSLGADRKLRFYDNCDRYLALHGDEPHPVKGSDYEDRVKVFQRGALYTGLAREVSERLDISADHVLGAKELHAVYRACNYDTVREGSVSPWCTLLGERGMRIMEYRDGMLPLARTAWCAQQLAAMRCIAATDMKQWWLKSHPYEENYRMSCPLLVDMVTHMEAVLGVYLHSPLACQNALVP